MQILWEPPLQFHALLSRIFYFDSAGGQVFFMPFDFFFFRTITVILFFMQTTVGITEN